MYEIYGTQNCTFCHKAQQLLTEHDKTYTFIDVAQDPIQTSAFFRKFPGVKTVPQIMYGEEHIGGYQELRNSLTLDEIESIL